MELILLNDIDKNNKSFEDIKHIDENGVEFWYARELMPILQYSNWQNFEKIIDKDVEYNKITITKPVDKYTKTKNEKDKGTIIDAEVEVSQVWVVKNGLGLTKAYNSKEKALSYVEEINNKYLEMAELK